MKKILTTLGLVAVATCMHAQGTITFDTFAGSLKTNSALSSYSGGTSTGGNSGAMPGTANGFYFTLLIAASSPGANAGNAGWTQATYNGSGLIGNNYPTLAGDAEGPLGTAATAIDNWGPGATMSFMIVGWSANEGTTWQQVLAEVNSGVWAANGFFGESAIASGASGVPPTGTPLNVFTSAGTFNMYSVTSASVVPEPTTMALAGLGAGALMLFRRRK